MPPVTTGEFEAVLDKLRERLNDEIGHGTRYDKSSSFEQRVREVIKELLAPHGIVVDLSPHPYGFPDIALGEFGVEVKFTTGNVWRSVGNSVFEGYRSQSVRHIYIVFGKMGGTPEVRWGRYAECIVHVRTSHVPRFEVEIGAEENLFQKMEVSYDAFSQLSIEERMTHIRAYARRIHPGEHLWWLEDNPEQSRVVPLQVRLYMSLEQDEKRKLRAEAALLCPQIVKPSRAKHKYDAAAIYLITYHGVMCSQARDLFSAGSVAMRSDQTRGGNYILRALEDIQAEMRAAAKDLDDALFVEYWGQSVQPSQRIRQWLRRADELAVGWKPSEHLFLRHH